MSLTFTCLKLTDGTTTLDLLDATKWGLVGGGWLPTPPPLRAGLLGAAGPVEDMDDEIRLQVRGTGTAGSTSRFDPSANATRLADTQTQFVTNMLALWTMMDKVARFGRGDPAAPAVVLQVCLAGATVATPSVPQQVLLLGPPGMDPAQPTFVLPNSGLNITLFADNYGEVTLRFRRRGMFTPVLAAITAGSTASAAGTLVTQSTGLTAVSVPSPTYIQITGWGPSSTPTLASMYLLVGEANAIAILDAEGGTTTNWTSVADSANNARNGNILRYTPVDTLPSSSHIAAFTALSGFIRVAVLAVVRNASSQNFRLKAVLSSGYAFTVGGQVETREVLIDASTPYPRVVNLGEASLRGGMKSLFFTAAVDDATGGPALDIDYVVVANIGDETTSILTLDPADVSQFATLAGGIIIDPETLTALAPSVTAVGSGALPLSPHGDATILTKGSTITTLFLATGGGLPGSWRFTTVAGSPALVTLTWYFRRWSSYVLPL